MKKFRHALSFLLVFVMLFSTSVPAFATSFPTRNENSSVIVTDSGVYINDVYYTQEQFVQLLETAQEVETETGNQTRSAAAAALVAVIVSRFVQSEARCSLRGLLLFYDAVI